MRFRAAVRVGITTIVPGVEVVDVAPVEVVVGGAGGDALGCPAHARLTADCVLTHCNTHHNNN